MTGQASGGSGSSPFGEIIRLVMGAQERSLTVAQAWSESLQQLAFDVQATADQVRQPEFGGVLEGTRGLSFESWDSVNRALADQAEKGIAVESLQRH